MEKISIHAFRAVDSKEHTIRYLHEHSRVLQDIGVSSAMKMDIGWCLDPESTIIAAFHETLGMVGGVRIQIGRAGHPMSMEKAIGQLAPEFQSNFAKWIEHGTAELCGLWVAHRFLGHGLPKLLVPAGVAVASQLNIRSLITFAAEYTLQLTMDSGFRRMTEVGKDGEFTYPIPSIRSYAMAINDLFVLENSPADKRKDLLSLRVRPEQYAFTRPKNTYLQVRYSLLRDSSRLHTVPSEGLDDVIRLRRTG